MFWKLFPFSLTSEITFRHWNNFCVSCLQLLCRGHRITINKVMNLTKEVDADFNLTLDSRSFQFSPNAVEAHNIFINISHYYLGHLISYPSCNSLLSSVSLRVYASIPWLSARYPRTVSSFLFRNIRVTIYPASCLRSREDAIERILSRY